MIIKENTTGYQLIKRAVLYAIDERLFATSYANALLMLFELGSICPICGLSQTDPNTTKPEGHRHPHLTVSGNTFVGNPTDYQGVPLADLL